MFFLSARLSGGATQQSVSPPLSDSLQPPYRFFKFALPAGGVPAARLALTARSTGLPLGGVRSDAWKHRIGGIRVSRSVPTTQPRIRVMLRGRIGGGLRGSELQTHRARQSRLRNANESSHPSPPNKLLNPTAARGSVVVSW